MANFTHIIFDLDGTLTDPRQGIRNSINYVMEKMHLSSYSEELLERFIGPSLQWGFSNIFGMNEKNTEQAVEYFREYFGEKGLYENKPYPGIHEMLANLKEAGKEMFIASSKLEKYVHTIVEYFEFNKYITMVRGADHMGEKSSKKVLISDILAIRELNHSKNIIIAGDTVFDVAGGKHNKISTVALGYGFGIKDELLNAEPDYYTDSVEGLKRILLK
ncbi:MAG: HAD hydrolase-like protein [Bacteroidales bacterium]|jgi:phosphoglycolate phosphatase|nr:HAD hydrolase-like protein [Bacteroidales bacterium]